MDINTTTSTSIIFFTTVVSKIQMDAYSGFGPLPGLWAQLLFILPTVILQSTLSIMKSSLLFI